jgi:hypothetical protein
MNKDTRHMTTVIHHKVSSELENNLSSEGD